MRAEAHVDSVRETRLSNFDGPVPHKRGPKYPQAPKAAHVFNPYWVSAFVGGRGSGKTYAAARMLLQYERFGLIDPDTKKPVCQRIVIISPSFDSNPVWTGLKHLDPADVHEKYSEDTLQDILDDIKAEKANTDEYLAKLELFKAIKKIKHEDDLTPEMEDLLEETDGDVRRLHKPRYTARCVVFLILDDLVGSGAYDNKSKNLLTSVTLKNRHSGICVAFLVQNMKAVPKSIRVNISLWFLFSFANKRSVLDDLYIEVSRLVTEQQFERLYAHATADDHGFLLVDLGSGVPKPQRFRAGFDRFLTLS